MRLQRGPSRLSVAAVAALLGLAVVAAYLWGPLHGTYERACELYPFLRSVGPATLMVLLMVGLSSLTMGIGGLLAGMIRSIRLSNRVRQSQVAEPPRLKTVASELGIAERVVCIGGTEPLAFCYGLVRPMVCVSAPMVNFLASEELQAVLAHEREHLLARDPLWLLCGKALSRALFMIPLSDALYKSYVLRREIRADDGCLAACRRESLASALLKLMGSGTVEPLGGVGFNLLEERIRYLTEADGSRSFTFPLYEGIGRSLIMLGLSLAGFAVLAGTAPEAVVGCLL